MRAALNHLATKDELRAEIGKVAPRIDALEARVGRLEVELDALRVHLTAALVQLEQRLLIKLGAMLAADVVLLATLAKLGT